MNSSSTLVATVSINYEDFTEGFLTCGTCLYAYDQVEHNPKLLSCSHTICQSCLELIASSPSLNNSAEAGCFKCPICRQNIAIPSGGISALPPSFLVNQLFDLVNKKPREFIPKCSVHIEQELLFCETCDCVFCDTCNKNNDESDDSLTSTTSNSNNINSPPSIASSLISSPNNNNCNKPPSNKEHISEACTVIPFSTAIKRMSEILNYRSQQCLNKLDEARANVQREVDRLESNCSGALKDIEVAFEHIRRFVDEREKQLLDETNDLHEYKKNVLLEQLQNIENEKSSLNISGSVKINNETDVKNLSKKISDLSNKNDTALALFTPRENCFICYEDESQVTLDNIQNQINDFGKIRTSKTYPPHCTSELLDYSTHMRSVALVQSIDYDGNQQKFGGDPIQAELKLIMMPQQNNNNSNFNPVNSQAELINGEIEIKDKRNGTYEVSFVPPTPGKYELYIYIFNRPIKNCPLTFETNIHHNPIAIWGTNSKKGVQDQFDSFNQPASLTINKHNGRIYVLDSFNFRIKILAQINSLECPFSFMQHIQPEFFGRSCTGIALRYPEEDRQVDEHHGGVAGIQAISLSPTKNPPTPNILVTDWRNRVIYELNSDGKLLSQYGHDDMLEPTNIVVDSRGRIFVVDRECIFVFNSMGKLVHKLTGYKYSTTTNNTSSSSSSSLLADKVDDTSSFKKKLNSASSGQQCQYQHQQQQHQHQFNNMESHKKIPLADILTDNKEQQASVNTTKANSNIATNNYIISSVGNDKRSNLKTNTLSSLISIRMKPKLNANSPLQRGSKAVMSAASRIRSTFTLSHSTSLVSAASLQSMFNNKHQLNGSISVGLNQQQYGERGSNAPSVITNTTATLPPQQQQQLASDRIVHKNNKAKLIDAAAGAAAMSNCGNKQRHQSLQRQATLATTGINYDNASDELLVHQEEDLVEPFGIIRGIAIGPDDELVVADESRVRVLAPGDDDYVFKRELFVQNRHHQGHNHQMATVCSMTYDVQSKKLLILYTSAIPYIQIVDYVSGKPKFSIDSHESKLIRPSCLATYGQHVIVTDLGNDCIKKYRFY